MGTAVQKWGKMLEIKWIDTKGKLRYCKIHQNSM
jgi:hypothetical protein